MNILAPDKIEKAACGLREGDSKRILLSSPWAYFLLFEPAGPGSFETRSGRTFSPAEWLLRKMGQNLHMQNATWLVVGNWLTLPVPGTPVSTMIKTASIFSCRVPWSPKGTRFRAGRTSILQSFWGGRISFIGGSVTKKESLLHSNANAHQSLRRLKIANVFEEPV